MDKGSWQGTVHGVTGVRHDLVTTEQQQINNKKMNVLKKNGLKFFFKADSSVSLVQSFSRV